MGAHRCATRTRSLEGLVTTERDGEVGQMTREIGLFLATLIRLEVPKFNYGRA
jgi:hypothetical protein